MSSFSEIPVGTYFKANGATYKKIDALYYVDPSDPTLEHMTNPMFEATINEKVAKAGELDVTAKFILDANTRFLRPNPNYDVSGELKVAALDAFSELWGTGFFDCGPEDIQFMTEKIMYLIEFKLQSAVKELPVPPAKVKKKMAAKEAGKKMAKKSAPKKTKKPVKVEKTLPTSTPRSRRSPRTSGTSR